MSVVPQQATCLETLARNRRDGSAASTNRQRHRAAREPGGRDRSGGSALLFENIEGSSIPVTINLFGNYERMRSELEDGKNPSVRWGDGPTKHRKKIGRPGRTSKGEWVQWWVIGQDRWRRRPGSPPVRFAYEGLD
ncbi:MAG: UbiD family decarboxylase [Planctomycetes bacterium]|nr:UbiD family decarboxylase [Planctomycetota bacterium]